MSSALRRYSLLYFYFSFHRVLLGNLFTGFFLKKVYTMVKYTTALEEASHLMSLTGL